MQTGSTVRMVMPSVCARDAHVMEVLNLWTLEFYGQFLFKLSLPPSLLCVSRRPGRRGRGGALRSDEEAVRAYTRRVP
jgi:hypothetical protein